MGIISHKEGMRDEAMKYEVITTNNQPLTTNQ